MLKGGSQKDHRRCMTAASYCKPLGLSVSAYEAVQACPGVVNLERAAYKLPSITPLFKIPSVYSQSSERVVVEASSSCPRFRRVSVTRARPHLVMAAPSAQARVTIQDAFERFASTVTSDDQRQFHNTQLKDVREAAIRIEHELRGRRMQRNMARLDPFLRGMEHYSKVVEVLCNGTPFLPWIWAPVKMMLMVSSRTYRRGPDYLM